MKLPRLRSIGSYLLELDLASPLSKWLPPGVVQAPPGAATQLLSSLKEQMVIEYPCLGMPLPDFILSWLSGTEARDHPRQTSLSSGYTARLPVPSRNQELPKMAAHMERAGNPSPRAGPLEDFTLGQY